MTSRVLGRAVLIGSLCLALGACASVQIGRAQALAKAGVGASAALDTAAAQVAQSFKDGRHAEDLQDAIIGAPPSPPTAHYRQVVTQLKARRDVAAQLKDAYGAFESLATYNAKGEFQQSASSLFDAIDAAGTAANASEKTDRAIFGQLGGELLAWDQARRLAKASAALRKGLTIYARILDKSSPGFIQIEQEAVNAHYDVVDKLWKNGLLEGRDIVGSVAPEAGLSLAARPDGFTHQDPKADAIVAYVLSSRRSDALQAVIDADQANRALVDQLIRKHAQFEAGGPLSFSELQSSANALVTATDAIVKAREGH